MVRCRTAASSGYPALIASTNSLFLTHVLLPDDPANKRRLLLAMLGSLSPAIWQRASITALARIGRVGSITSFDEAVNQISPNGRRQPQGSPGPRRRARTARTAVTDLISQQKFPEAIDQAALANRQLKEAFCLAQKPLPGEFRAFWCHSAFGVQGMEWDEAIQRLATNGFTAILPNMLWGGATFYPGKVLPVHHCHRPARRSNRPMPRRLPEIRPAGACLESELEPGHGCSTRVRR